MPALRTSRTGTTPRPLSYLFSRLYLIKVYALCALALLILLAPQSARAGQWQITYTGTVSRTEDWGDGPYTTTDDLSSLATHGSGVGFDTSPWDEGNNTASGAVQSQTAAPTFTVTWVPAPGQTLATDPPPNGGRLSLKQTACARALAYLYDSSGGILPGLDFSATLADDGLGDPAVDDGTPDWFSGKAVDLYSRGVHLIRRDGSSGTVTLSPSLSAVGSVLGPVNSSYPYCASTGLSYSLALDDRGVAINTSLDGTNAASPDPTNRQLTGWASLNWKVQDDDSPSVSFYDGYARYFMNATGFTPTSYTWQTDHAQFVQSMATPDDLIWQLPDASVSEKHFHFDLGDDFTRFPQQTAVTGTANGTDPYLGAFSGAATATVTWHSPWEGAAGGAGMSEGGPKATGRTTPAACLRSAA